MSLVSNISYLCEKQGISLTKLEQATGLHNIYRWDSVTPSFDKVVKVAEYFDVPVDYLTGREYKAPDYATDEDLEALHKNPDLRVLLSAGAHLSKSDIEFVADMIRRMRGND